MMEQNDEDFNYDSQYKKLCTGLGSFLSSAHQSNHFQEGIQTNDGSLSSTSYSSEDLSKCKKYMIYIPANSMHLNSTV